MKTFDLSFNFENGIFQMIISENRQIDGMQLQADIHVHVRIHCTGEYNYTHSAILKCIQYYNFIVLQLLHYGTTACIGMLVHVHVLRYTRVNCIYMYMYIYIIYIFIYMQYRDRHTLAHIICSVLENTQPLSAMLKYYTIMMMSSYSYTTLHYSNTLQLLMAFVKT